MHLEVSLADGLDRLTILEIKKSKITCPIKLKEIQKELLTIKYQWVSELPKDATCQ